MADDDKKKEGEETEEKKSGGGAMKMVLMIGLPLILFQAGIAYFLISKIAQPQQAVADVAEEEQDDSGEPGLLYMVPDVIVNPAGTQGIRFLNITLALEFTNPDVEKELTEKEVQLRDILIGILVSKTLEDIDSSEEKDMLKEEIREKVNGLLKSGKIRKVYFSNFVMQ